MHKPRGLRAAAPLPSVEMIHSRQAMSSVSAETGGPAEIMAGQGAWLEQRWALGWNGDGRLTTMEHEAGIEQVTGHRLESGCRYGSGHGFRFGY